jgi:hypothetical protein
MTLLGLRLPTTLVETQKESEDEHDTIDNWRRSIIERQPNNDELRRFIIAMDHVYTSCRTVGDRKKADSLKISDV